MRRLLARAVATALLCAWVPSAADAGPRSFADGRLDISVVVDGPGERDARFGDLVRDELLQLVEGEFLVELPAGKRRVADWTGEGVAEALDEALADPEVDLVLALGTLASHLAATRASLPKPVFAPFVLDPDLQGVPRSGSASGVRNLAYLTMPASVEDQLATLSRIAPFEHLAVLASGPLLEALPDEYPQRFDVMEQDGVALQVVHVGLEAGPALAALGDEVDAVYVTALPQLPSSELDGLVAGLIERQLPSFSGFGRSHVERGMLAGVGQASLMPVLARRVALGLQQYLLGDELGDLPTTLSAREQLAINLDTAAAIGLSPRWDVLAEAERIHEKPGAEVRLTITEAVHEALAANLGIAAGRAEVEAGEEAVVEARANLLPAVEIGALASTIDADRAEAAMGGAAQHAASASATVVQPLFVEPTYAGLAIQRRLQEGREQGQRNRETDVVDEAASAYLTVLRARTFESLQQDNLRVTREHLDLARVRQRIGVAGPAEVHRWEVELALARKASLEAFYSRRLADVALNRVLHRPLDGPVYLMEHRLGDPGLLTDEERLVPYVDDPRAFAALTDFMVARGLAASPELARLDAAIAAQDRLHRSARRSIYTPTVGLAASASQDLYEGGAGSEVPDGMPAPDDTDWQVGIQASLPLFSGGSQRARVARAGAELAQLELERAAAAERIEQRIRSALFAGLSSLQGLAHADEAAVAAHANLEISTHAYSVGSLSILDLLDAQQAAFQTDLGRIDAEYAFLLDLVGSMRATNRYAFLESEAEREAWYRDLDAWFADLGLTPGPR